MCVEGYPNRKIRLNVGMDHPKFSEHYWSRRAGIELKHEPETTTVRQSIQWLRDKYLQHLERIVEARQASAATLRQRKSLLTRRSPGSVPAKSDQSVPVTVGYTPRIFLMMNHVDIDIVLAFGACTILRDRPNAALQAENLIPMHRRFFATTRLVALCGGVVFALR